MKRYTFNLDICGEGNNVQEAWEDAVLAFSLEPGDPEDVEYEIEDEYEEEE